MNDTRIRIFKRHAAYSLRCAFLFGFGIQTVMMPVLVFADTSLPPSTVHQTMNNGFPSSQALKNQGYDPSTGILRVQETNNGSSTVKKTGDTITGKQSKTVTITGNYGERATATTSITQNVSSSKLQTAANLAIAGNVAGGSISSAIDKYSDLLSSQIKSGNYYDAFETSAQIVRESINNLSGGLIGSTTNLLGKIFNWDLAPTPDDYKKMADALNQELIKRLNSGDLAGALENAALKKALDAASKINVDLDDFTKAKLANATKGASGNYKSLYLLKLTIDDNNFVSWVMPKQPSYDIYTLSNRSGSVGATGISKLYLYSGHQVANQYYDRFHGSTVKQILTDADLNDAISKISTPSDVQIKQTVQAMPLTETDVNSILQKMLDSQETNHKQLMDQLGKLGNIIPDATTSKEWQPVVMTTDPYTPLGSNVAQQTQFVISSDGTVSSSTISRPDLPANSSFAPTRTLIQSSSPSAGTGTSTGTETPLESEQKPSCSENPNDASCFGNMDYQDLSLPEQTIDLNFKPSDYFSTTGVCPQPLIFDFGKFGRHEFKFDYICAFAEGFRPVLILGTMISCAVMAYGAIKEL